MIRLSYSKLTSSSHQPIPARSVSARVEARQPVDNRRLATGVKHGPHPCRCRCPIRRRRYVYVGDQQRRRVRVVFLKTGECQNLLPLSIDNRALPMESLGPWPSTSRRGLQHSALTTTQHCPLMALAGATVRSIIGPRDPLVSCDARRRAVAPSSRRQPTGRSGDSRSGRLRP